MKITFLGTGTSQGVPLIAQPEGGCDLNNPKNWRTRCSIHVEMGGTHIQVDAAPEFRLQCIHNDITDLDVFILTHGHADHVLGMDDLRRFCDLKGGVEIPVYSTEEGMQRVRSIYPYATTGKPLQRGYAAFALQAMPEVLQLPGGTVRSTLLEHASVDTLGLIFEEEGTGKKFTYYTDCRAVNPEQRDFARGSDVVVLDALKFTEHRSHMTVAQATEVALDIAAPQTYFTHMTFQVDHDKASADLPPGVAFAYDGLVVEL